MLVSMAILGHRTRETGGSADTANADGHRADDELLKTKGDELDKALGTLTDSFAKARMTVTGLEAKRDAQVTSAREKLAKLAEPTKIAAVGTITKVTLYDTHVKYGNKLYELNESVQASADQQGMKQVVQGWVFKSNQDRRELYLHVQSPGWSFVAGFRLQYSLVTPAELVAFADRLNMQARSAVAVKATKQAGQRRTQVELAMALSADAALVDVAEELLTIAANTEPAADTAANLRNLIEQADPDSRRVRKVRERLDRMESRLVALKRDAQSEHERIAQASVAQRQQSSQLIAKAAADAVNGSAPESVERWLDDVAARLTADGFVETARITDAEFGAETLNANMTLAHPEARVLVFLFPDEDAAARSVDPELGGKGLVKAVNSSCSIITRRGRVVVVGNNPYKINKDIFGPWADTVFSYEPPPPWTPLEPSAQAGQQPTEGASVGAADPIEALRKLGELRDAGIVTDEEFAAKKEELLKRV